MLNDDTIHAEHILQVRGWVGVVVLVVCNAEDTLVVLTQALIKSSGNEGMGVISIGGCNATLSPWLLKIIIEKYDTFIFGGWVACGYIIHPSAQRLLSSSDTSLNSETS
jgi:hypothetical protein